MTRTALPEVPVIDPDVHRDQRGFFLETYHRDRYVEHGIAMVFVRDNHSKSGGRTIRGLHLQVQHPQAKLIRVIDGEIFDVAVDVRRGSPTFGRWVSSTLSADNFRVCYVPERFAHGFAVTSRSAEVEYKCSDIYFPEGEVGITWNDPRLAISWPFDQPVLSVRDGRHPTLAEREDQLPVYRPPNP